MSTLTKVTTLPKIADLYADKDLYNENQEMHTLLNQPPSPSWIQEHPQTKMKYIPIGRTEYLLNMIFVDWHVEVLGSQLLANSIAVTVRLHLTYPNGTKRHFDGVGAAPLQTSAGAGAIDFNQIKSAAVQMALPAAKSYAIKDAADHIGNLFGKDLNRKAIETSFFSIQTDEKALQQVTDAQVIESLRTHLSSITDMDDFKAYGLQITKSDYSDSVKTEFRALCTAWHTAYKAKQQQS
jgi:hypothetical protein